MYQPLAEHHSIVESEKPVKQLKQWPTEHVLMWGKADNLIPLTCFYNMGWQTQSKRFNSNTDKAAAMSLQSGKIMNFTTAGHVTMPKD